MSHAPAIARIKQPRLSEPAKWAVLGGACVAGASVLFLSNPAGPGSFYPPCPVYFLTGIYCPGCGTARALHQLLHGDVLAALGYNPLLVVALPFIVYTLASYALRWTRQRPLPAILVSRAINNGALWVVGAYWILRNIPFYPFNLLAP